jgi:hypothetical protein
MIKDEYKKWLFVIFSLLIIFFVALSFNFYFKKNLNKKNDAVNLVGEIFPKGDLGSVLKGKSEYKNNRYGFSLVYPNEMKVSEYDEGSSAMTIAFENKIDKKGFQIFIVPYLEKQVGVERIKKDIPSGIQNDLKNFTVGGVVGASFYSVIPAIGDTFEVWFLKNGFLYEVTVPKSLESFLVEILSSWKFL